MDLKLLFENEDLLAVDKPPGILTIPNRQKEVSLKEILASRCGRVYVVHRLDRATSGLVLFARNARTHRYLNTLFEKRMMKKEYICVVKGSPPDEFLVDEPLREFGSGRVFRDIRGKEAVTRFCVISKGKGLTVLKAMPLTGRRHQIRAHLFGKGFVILGDMLYGKAEGSRLMLHSHRLEFTDQRGIFVSLVCPLPKEFFPYLDA